MALKDNEVFLRLKEKSDAYFEEKQRAEKEKSEIIEKGGWENNPELDVWYERLKEHEKTRLPGGTVRALFFWREAAREGREEIVMNDFLWDDDVKDFADTMKSAGIESLVTIDRSTGLMGNLHALAENGYEPEGLCLVEMKDFRGEARKAQGIRLVLRKQDGKRG